MEPKEVILKALNHDLSIVRDDIARTEMAQKRAFANQDLSAYTRYWIDSGMADHLVTQRAVETDILAAIAWMNRPRYRIRVLDTGFRTEPI